MPRAATRDSAPPADANTRVLAKPALNAGIVGPPPPSLAPRPVEPAQLEQRYVSGAGLQWYGQFARALPWAIDDLTTQFGDDLYQRMLRDPQVAACITVIKAAVLEDGLSLAPAVEDVADPDYEMAVALHDEAEAMLDRLETPLDDVLWNLLDALAFGNKVAEQVYDLERPATTGPRLGRDPILRLKALQVKPRRTTAFVVDGYLNLVGLLVQELNQPSPVLTGWMLDPRDPPPNLIPPAKFLIFSFRQTDADPRGTSVLRAAYTPWWMKEQVLPEYRRYLANFAVPSLIGITGEQSQSRLAADGTTVITPEQDLTSALTALYRNASVVAIPFGNEVKPLEVQARGDVFTRAWALFDQQITKAILTQQLATEEGAHQARAAAEVHQDVLDTLIRQAKRSLLQAISRQVLRPWVTWNWGERVAHLTPKPTLGTTERQDLPQMMTAVATAYTAGYLHPSQMSATDQMLGLPVRDLTEDDAADETALAPGPSNPARPTGAGGGMPPPAAAGTPARKPAAFADDPTPLFPVPGLMPAPAEDAEAHTQHASRLWNAAVPALAGLLAGRRYRWEPAKARYRDTWRGRLVAPERVLRARDRLADTRAESVAQMAEGVSTGGLSLDTWEATMRGEIFRTYLAQYAAGKGGWAAMTQADFAAVNALVRDQFGYLAGFSQAVATGQLSREAIAARSALYVSSSVQAFEHGKAAAFDVDLPAYPGDGTSACMANDRCAWNLVRRPDGGVDAFWLTEGDKKVCDTCAGRGRDWAPLTLRPQEMAA